MLKKEKKSDLIKEHGIHEKDTGSCEVQVALLSEQIDSLALHLKNHPKDMHSKRGLVKMVVKRKKLLNYLQQEDEKRYKDVIKKVGLKK
jgi:small subunit ribosomal protein S15